MSVLGRVTGWLSGKGANNAQAGYGAYRSRGYYGSSQAEDAYGAMSPDRFIPDPSHNDHQASEPLSDRYSNDQDPYNGRVPYRSEQESYASRNDMPRNAQSTVPNTYAQQGYQQPEQTQYRQTGNVVDFPGQQEAAPVHVEYVILLRSRNECTKVIEYIKTNASVFLNMEYIANESERQRCVDMLSGAAYTLGCRLHKISNRGIYLIASPYVRVMIDPAMKRFSSVSESQSYMQQQTGVDAMEYEQEHIPQHAQAQPFARQTREEPAYRQTDAPAHTPFSQPQQQQQRQPQQQAYSPFQRPRPSLKTQQQQEPFRRASGGQYFSRQASADTSTF